MNLPFSGLAISLKPDLISLVMVFFALSMTLCSALFAWGYHVSERKDLNRSFWVGLWSFGLFATLTFLAGDWFSLTIFLELSTLSLFLMVLAGDSRTAIMYLITQFTGAGLLLVGTGALFLETGSISIGPVTPSAVPFFILGLGIKAALPGLHFWLPGTHSMAPSPASVLLSGVAVKLGIYGLIRLASPWLAPWFLSLGLIMALYGVLQALLQHDGKRLLAFHTISQLGFVLSALGSGTELGILAALFYSLAHGVFKGLLFCSIGVLEKRYQTRDLGQLGRGIASDPLTFALFLVGALAITGFPGTSGFVAKSLVKEALKAGPHGFASLVLVAAGTGTAISFSKMGYYGFMKGKDLFPGPITEKKVFPGRARCHTAMAILALATLLMGSLPILIPGRLSLDGAFLLSFKNILSAMVPMVGGFFIFFLIPGIFSPAGQDVPDLYDLMNRLERPLAIFSWTLQKGHSGRVRSYMKFLLAVIVVIFYILAASGI